MANRIHADGRARYRLAVDIGGTFTDAVVMHDNAVLASLKVLTTPRDPADGFLAATHKLLEDAGIATGQVGLIIHGTTLATNALIERRGARTALITTQGHRDALEMAYENRFAQYDISANRAPPLVPRELRLPVRERLNYRGVIIEQLDEESVAALVPKLCGAQVESLAIGLLHAYANPAHEQRIAQMLAEHLPDLAISLSSDVCPEIREYDRQSTTVANAYIKPLMAQYLNRLESDLAGAGFACPFLLMTSGGHLVDAKTASAHPVRLIESGPAGGAILASRIARTIGAPEALSFDMGGTTAKICLIDNGEPQLGRMFEVDRAHRFMKGSGSPVKIPVIEMVEIGAGGGSLASVDDLGRIRVGPQSAGSDPGPACYGRGGTEPAVTDANVMLGRIDAASFAGGSMPLDTAAAERALKTVAAPLSWQAGEAAHGILETVNEAMAAAARVHAVELGKDIAKRTMIAFGGAAPLHAARLAQKLVLDRIVIPADAGVGSAVGFLLAPVAYEVVRSNYQRLAGLDENGLNGMFAAMQAEARATVCLAQPEAELYEVRRAYARYAGQGHEITLHLPDTDFDDTSPNVLRDLFEIEYQRQYGRTVPGQDIEVLTWSLTLSAEISDTQDATTRWTESDNTSTEPDSDGIRTIDLSDGTGVAQAVPVYRRATLLPGDTITGPAVIVEDQTTVLVPEGFILTVVADGHLLMERHLATQASATGLAEMRNQVIWDRLIAVVEEQAQALIRTAFSTTVREAGDLSAGVFDLKGHMLAQAVTGTPGHVNAMAASVPAFLERFPSAGMRPGDVFVTNDPWLGTGHTWDFTLVTPAFLANNVIGFLAATIHVIDVGGRGFGPDAGQVFEEGICIPPMKLFDAGAPNDCLFEIVRSNVRQPVELVGDLYSLTASNDVGVKRLIETMREFGLADLDGIARHIIETSRQAMLAEIATLPPGTYQNAMTVDGYEAPLTLNASMTISADGIGIDFAGTSPASAYGINVPLTYTQAYASFGVRCIIGSTVPNNTGSLQPIAVTATEGSVLNAPRPAAVAARHVIGQMLPDVVLGCLEQARPGCAPAEGSSSLWNPMLTGGQGIAGASGEPFTITIFHSGGTGARPGQHGLSATAFPSGVRNTPVEITEALAPLIFRRKEFREGSGGTGKWRGGDGQVIEIAHAANAPFALFALFDRIDHPARGRAGGGNGAPGRLYLASGEILKGKGKQIIPAGDRVIMELPGGGSLGEPDA